MMSCYVKCWVGEDGLKIPVVVEAKGRDVEVELMVDTQGGGIMTVPVHSFTQSGNYMLPTFTSLSSRILTTKTVFARIQHTTIHHSPPTNMDALMSEINAKRKLLSIE
jgi:hypothetical protein